MNYIELSKEISYALRHAPHEYELELDNEGWTDLKCLLDSLRLNPKFSDLTELDITKMIERSEKKRHEVSNGKIRAIYGHSTNKRIVQKPANPPNILYHGTANKFIKRILNEGLISKERQYVHLSEDIETALSVGKRREEQPVILKVNAKNAYNDGITFYFANEKIWLADIIPAKYLEII